MTTETILTGTTRSAFESACRQHAEDAGYENHERLARDGDGYADPHTQAAWWGWCEALQSPEVQAWKRDAERYRATRAGLVGTDPDYGSRFCEYCDEMGIKQAENITEEQFDAATDAAMEHKHEQ